VHPRGKADAAMRNDVVDDPGAAGPHEAGAQTSKGRPNSLAGKGTLRVCRSWEERPFVRQFAPAYRCRRARCRQDQANLRVGRERCLDAHIMLLWDAIERTDRAGRAWLRTMLSILPRAAEAQTGMRLTASLSTSPRAEPSDGHLQKNPFLRHTLSG
jgi:hypothetical protein